MSRPSKVAPLALGAMALCALLAIPASAANLSSGQFFVRASNDATPTIEATAGLKGTVTGGNPGGPTDPGGGDPGGGSEDRSFSFSCGTGSLELTPAMFEWSDANREAAASGGTVKPYSNGGWNYIIPFEETGAYYDTYSMFEAAGYEVDIYALSSELTPNLTPGPLGFDSDGLSNTAGPAFAMSVKDPSGNQLLCSYGKARNGLAHGDSPTDPAYFQKNPGTTSSYFAQNGMLVASDSRPAGVISGINTETYWARDGVSWEDATRLPRLYGVLRDRGSLPGMTEARQNGEVRSVVYRGSGDGDSVYIDSTVRNSSGVLLMRDSSIYSFTFSSGGTSETMNAGKPANRIDGPSAIYYNADGSIERTEYQWEGQAPGESSPPSSENQYQSLLTQSYYEDTVGGTGWIGYYQNSTRNTEIDR